MKFGFAIQKLEIFEKTPQGFKITGLCQKASQSLNISFSNFQVAKFMMYEIISGTSGIFHLSSINVLLLMHFTSVIFDCDQKTHFPISSGKLFPPNQIGFTLFPGKMGRNQPEINLFIYSGQRCRRSLWYLNTELQPGDREGCSSCLHCSHSHNCLSEQKCALSIST